MESPNFGQAIVIGGSMAGLIAARALADHFAQVTVIERDRWPDGPAPRRGVPQARHVHVLLLRGQHILGQWFPGLEDDLGAAGAPQVDVTGDGLWLNRAGWGRVFSSGLHLRTCSRDLREWVLRRQLRTVPAVRFREECEVVGLRTATPGGPVSGVRMRARGSAADPAGAEEELAADLVVDASGRGSHAPHWLTALGYVQPAERVINSFLGYSSRYYAPAEGFTPPWRQGIYIQTAPPAHLRGGGSYVVEGGRWLVTLVGAGRDYPPTSDPEFLAFARSLRSPLIYEALHHAQPLSPIAGYRGTENRWRRYDQLARWPERFVVLGDAACAFNPVYGQGMAAAALGAATLADLLRDQRRRHPNGDLTGLARRFQRRLAGHHRRLWLIATIEDFRCPQTEGGPPTLRDRLAQRYMDRVLRRATVDPVAYMTLVEVLHLLKPPRALAGPGMLLRVLRPGPPAHPAYPPPAPDPA
jgi:2-polyprenyl-6-methoxyphenol hydroxylase-like FAD-dependent oxidoreductase